MVVLFVEVVVEVLEDVLVDVLVVVDVEVLVEVSEYIEDGSVVGSVDVVVNSVVVVCSMVVVTSDGCSVVVGSTSWLFDVAIDFEVLWVVFFLLLASLVVFFNVLCNQSISLFKRVVPKKLTELVEVTVLFLGVPKQVCLPQHLII